MRRRRPAPFLVGVLAALSCAWLLTLALPASPLLVHVSAARPAPRGPLPWLSVKGRRIVDPDGRTVILRGVNVDALVDYGGGYHALPFGESDAELIQRSGFNVVRLAISWSELEPIRGRVNESYIDRIAALVSLLNQHGLYVVLDMHFMPAFNPRFDGAGAPRWAALPLIPGFESSTNYWLKQVLTPDANAGFVYFVASADWQSDYEMVWQAVARRFRDDPGVAAYDLINEPHPFPIPPHVFERYFLWPFYARIIDAIGEVDGNHVFVVDNAMFSNLPTDVTPIRGAQVVYGPHVYYGVFGWPTFAVHSDGLARYIAGLDAEAAQLPGPLWVGETGTNSGWSDAAAWTEQSLDAYDSLNAGFAWWQWRENSHWGIRNRAGLVKWNYLRLIARPFLAAAPPGLRVSAAAADNSWVDVQVAADHGSGLVELSWPVDLLPPPRVTGACVFGSRWEPQRARLLLALVPDEACQVRVQAA